MDLKAGSIISDKFRVERLLGERGANDAVVVAARQLDNNRLVAIQVLPKTASERRVAMRFARAREIASPRVPMFLDVGRLPDDRPYVVMSLLQGMNLRRLHAGKPIPIVQAVDRVVQACEAIAAAHAVSLVHRRLTTSSLFLATDVPEDQGVKVLDFTLVDRSGPDVKAGESATEYSAPELFVKGDPDRRCDIWSLGVIPYELVTGKLPFTARSHDKLAKRIREEAAQPPSALRRDLPRALDEVILKCLEKQPEARFQSVGDLAAALVPFGTAASAAVAARLPRRSAAQNSIVPEPPPSDPMTMPTPAELPLTVPVFEPPPDAAIGFRRMSSDGSIEGMDADAVISYARGKRVAQQAEQLAKHQAEVLAKQKPVEEREDTGLMRAIGDGEPSSPRLSVIPHAPPRADAPPPSSPKPVAVAAPPPAPATAPAPEARPRPPAAAQAKAIAILILATAILFGLLLGMVWKVLLAR